MTTNATIRSAATEDADFLQAMIWEALLASPEFVARIGEPTLRAMEAATWARWVASPAGAREPAFIACEAARPDDGAPPERRLGAILLKNDVFVTDEDRARRAGAIAPGVVVERWRFGMGVAAEARGRGVGRALLAHAITYARDAGARELSLIVDRTNARARALYDAMGFVAVSEKDGAIEMRIHFAPET